MENRKKGLHPMFLMLIALIIIGGGVLSLTYKMEGAINWKTYKNAEYGFEAIYPELGTPTYYKEGEDGRPQEEIKSGALFLNEIIISEQDNILANNADLSKEPKLWLEEMNKLGGAPSAPTFLNELTVDGHKAIKAEGNYITGEEAFVFIGGDKAIYKIAIVYNPKEKEKYMKVLDQVISTFRFTK